MVDFDGINVGEYPSPMDAMGVRPQKRYQLQATISWRKTAEIVVSSYGPRASGIVIPMYAPGVLICKIYLHEWLEFMVKVGIPRLPKTLGLEVFGPQKHN